MSRHSTRAIESQIKQIDELFRTHNDPHYVTIVDVKKDKNCDFHKNSPSRRESVDVGSKNVSRRGSTVSNLDKRRSFCSTDKLNMDKERYQKSRNSIASFTELVNRNILNDENGNYRGQMRRESMPVIDTNGRRTSLDTWNNRLFKGMEHPSNFPNMLRSPSANNKMVDINRRASSSWNVNHYHNYTNEENGNKAATNLDRKQSMSTSEKIFKRDYTQSPEPGNNSNGKGKELHSILKHNKRDIQQSQQKPTTGDDELKEIIKRLSFDYIENEMSQNGHRMDIDLLSNSDSSSGGGNGRISTSTKLTPRRISIDSLESSSRRSSRRFSDFSVNSDDLGTFKSRFNKALMEVRDVCFL